MNISHQFMTIGEVTGTNDLRFPEGTAVVAAAIQLLETHTPGAPVVNAAGRYTGFVSELDILDALDEGLDLTDLRVEEIMNRKFICVSDSTPIQEAVKLMEQRHIQNLPVLENGLLAKTVSRHDLLRAGMGMGMGIE